MKKKATVSTFFKILFCLFLVAFGLFFYRYEFSLRNDIEIINQGRNIWSSVHFSGGGENFYFNQISKGESERVRFFSKAEDGGSVEGIVKEVQYINNDIAYFTPNMSTKVKIILKDSGEIKVMHPVEK